eukprot:Anaeramoba_ignava/a4963_9.p1 GENE.a4963_9~~a4963_9.p1  ORF type:complete len:300 (-),score=20.71 a4963_9:3-902(-)
MSSVSITKCDSYDYEEVYTNLKKALDSINLPTIKNKKILIKPNILSDVPPELGVTTHPILVKALIRILKDKGANKIYVGDSPAIHTVNFKAKRSGIFQICEEENVEWVNFHKETTKKDVPFVKRKVTVAKILDEIDFSISLAKCKTHELMFTTGAIKNMFGLVAGFNKSKQHVYNPSRRGFAKFICGLYSISKTEISIMDAIIAMEGAGPGNGDPKKLGLILASTDALALDISQATIMGYNPLDIPIIKFAIKRKLTETRKINDIQYPNLNANDLIVKDYKIITNKKNQRKKICSNIFK